MNNVYKYVCLLFFIVCMIMNQDTIVNAAEICETNPMVATGYRLTVALRHDGTVVATGDGDYSSLEEWRNIKEIAVSDSLIVGLQEDGTIRYNINGKNGTNGVVTWKDIEHVAASCIYIAGKKDDGTVIINKGEVDWKNINNLTGVFIRSCNGFLNIDDKGKLQYYDCSANKTGYFPHFNNLINVTTGYYLIAGLREDRTVIAYHDLNRDIKELPWKDIVEIAVDGGSVIYGITKEGTVITYDFNTDNEAVVNSWNDVVSIAGGNDHLIAVRSDGKLMAIGDNEYGQCNIESWDLTPLTGDANDDNAVNAKDALTILKVAAQIDDFGIDFIPGQWSPENAKITSGSLDDINAKDALEVLKIAAKVE